MAYPGWKVLLSLGVAFLIGASTATASDMDDLFKWGEYDSLILLVRPTLEAGDGKKEFTRLDSVIRAKSFLYLGVALYATGQQQPADAAFAQACDLDSAINIDRFYVSEAVATHFDLIADIVALSRAEARRLEPIRTEPEKIPAGKPTSRGRGGWTVGLAILLIGGGAILYLMTVRP